MDNILLDVAFPVVKVIGDNGFHIARSQTQRCYLFSDQPISTSASGVWELGETDGLKAVAVGLKR